MAEESKTLDQLLNNEEPEALGAEPAEAAPEEARSGPERDEHGRFAAKGVEEPQPETEAETVPPTDKLPKEDYKAIREEREKRQALERELEAVRQQMQQRPPEPAPDIWENTEGWQNHFGTQLVSQAVQASTSQARLQMSAMMMEQQHEDFAQVKDELVRFVGENPAINQQVAESQHPWSTAYKAYKNQQAVAELGATNLDELRAKLREEILAEAQAQSPVPGAPPTLTTERNVGARTGPAWAGPKPLDELLG